MSRLTHKRNNGIKEGYWSPNKKEELVQRLAEYEDTGLDPEQVQQLKERDTAKKPIIDRGEWSHWMQSGGNVQNAKEYLEVI